LWRTSERPFSARPVAIPRSRIERAIAPWPVAVLAETFATRRIRSLLATLSWCVRLFVAEFPVLEARGWTRVAVVAVTIRSIPARRVRALVATTVFTRPERTFFTVTASRRPIRKRTVAPRTRRITILAARRTIITFACIWTPFALRLPLKTALGKFLVRAPRNARTALAAGRPVASAPGIVVFIVVAGHEGSRFGCKYK
jgi:hypothetical protein